jgi:hypothetical protein
MGSGAQAARFLHELKAIFGIDNCYFLISVSDDAVVRFERRGLAARDAFDSSFDEIMRVPPFEFAQTSALLAERVIGLPLAFRGLCYCMSGGIPRDSIRYARAVLRDYDARHAPTELAEICRRLVESDWSAKRDAMLATLSAAKPRESAAYAVDWLARLTPGDLGTQTTAVDGPPPFSRGSAERDTVRLERLVAEFVSYSAFCVAVMRFFDGLAGQRMRIAESPNGGQLYLGQLASARRSLALDPLLAREQIDAFAAAWAGWAPREGGDSPGA